MAAEEQARPSAHGVPGQAVAPQSVPVSSPFWTPSLQVGATHLPSEQTPLAQSAGSKQLRLSAHGAHPSSSKPPPPQSMAVSLPF